MDLLQAAGVSNDVSNKIINKLLEGTMDMDTVRTILKQVSSDTMIHNLLDRFSGAELKDLLTKQPACVKVLTDVRRDSIPSWPALKECMLGLNDAVMRTVRKPKKSQLPVQHYQYESD
jgi:hypothetical protein